MYKTYRHFYNGKSNSVYRFSDKPPNRVKMSIWVNSGIKEIKRWHTRKIYWLNLEFYNTDRKMKNIIWRIFISIIMHPNFMHLRHKINFKIVLESFVSVSGHLRTVLKVEITAVSNMFFGIFYICMHDSGVIF